MIFGSRNVQVRAVFADCIRKRIAKLNQPVPIYQYANGILSGQYPPFGYVNTMHSSRIYSLWIDRGLHDIMKERRQYEDDIFYKLTFVRIVENILKGKFEPLTDISAMPLSADKSA